MIVSKQFINKDTSLVFTSDTFPFYIAIIAPVNYNTCSSPYNIYMHTNLWLRLSECIQESEYKPDTQDDFTNLGSRPARIAFTLSVRHWHMHSME